MTAYQGLLLPNPRLPGGRLGFAGHETFAFRYGWLKKDVDAVRRDPLALSSDQAALDLGVGKNMVQSIRYWGLATQVLREGAARALEISPLGAALLEDWDPYLEDTASLWLVHWLLVNNPARAAVWHLAFTRFNGPDFSKQALLAFLGEVRERGDLRVKDSTLSRDVDCFVRCYAVSKSSAKGPALSPSKGLLEDSFNCPLTELGLLYDLRDGDGYRFAVGPKPGLPPEVVGYALLEHMGRTRPALSPSKGQGRNSIAFSECLYGLGSPGQVFKLDENTLALHLETLEEITDGALEFDDTAGLRQVYRRREVEAEGLLRRYYGGRA